MSNQRITLLYNKYMTYNINNNNTGIGNMILYILIR